jgi:hypothetical protein
MSDTLIGFEKFYESQDKDSGSTIGFTSGPMETQGITRKDLDAVLRRQADMDRKLDALDRKLDIFLHELEAARADTATKFESIRVAFNESREAFQSLRGEAPKSKVASPSEKGKKSQKTFAKGQVYSGLAAPIMERTVGNTTFILFYLGKDEGGHHLVSEVKSTAVREGEIVIREEDYFVLNPCDIQKAWVPHVQSCKRASHGYRLVIDGVSGLIFPNACITPLHDGYTGPAIMVPSALRGNKSTPQEWLEAL